MTYAEGIANLVARFINVTAEAMSYWVNVTNLSNVTIKPSGEALVNAAIVSAHALVVLIMDFLQGLAT